MSYCLSARGVDHVVLERGHVAERWREHGWDSLRLLTPNWMTRLPGFGYDGDDPDGFMPVGDVIGLLERYAATSRAPVYTGTRVTSLDRDDRGFRVITTNGVWQSAVVVIATGYCDVPAVPGASRRVARRVQQLVPAHYRHPEQLSPGGVLVVGASSTGIQLAAEIQRSGRTVTLAAGRHIRLPRRYRGHDILWWLDRMGVLTQEAAMVHDIRLSRQQPSLQLVGSPDRSTLDLHTLQTLGVRLRGRLLDVRGPRAIFADDLVSTTAAADWKLAEIRTRIDRFIEGSGVAATETEPFSPTWPLGLDVPTLIDLNAERIKTIIWATGYRRTYPWLHLPVLDRRGEIRHESGITVQPGLYVLGLNFQRRRNSSFIGGVGPDAEFIADHLAASLISRVA
jgi:putative flavoprotein involved in K+ transport